MTDAIESSKRSTEIVRLIESVEQLADADQHRILKIVALLTRVPAHAQWASQRMLKSLLDAEPDSISECIEGVDDVIEYLEHEALAHESPAAPLESFDYTTN